MKKVRIIINPISGTGKQVRAEKAINRLLDTRLFESEIVYTQGVGHFTELARDAVKLNYEAVLVLGGDGSINEAAAGLIGSKTALGIIPIGSGNGFARHLGIPMNIDEAIQRFNQFQSKLVDTARMNDKTFVSIAGLGFDAHIAHLFSQAKGRGLYTYAKISIREFFKFKAQHISLNIDGNQIEASTFMTVFANANQFGNDFIISPLAKIDDGFLDVCLVQKPKLYQIPKLLFQIFRKHTQHSSLIQIIKAKKISLQLEKNTNLNMDGEAIKGQGELHISINPLSLSVIV